MKTRTKIARRDIYALVFGTVSRDIDKVRGMRADSAFGPWGNPYRSHAQEVNWPETLRKVKDLWSDADLPLQHARFVVEALNRHLADKQTLETMRNG